MPRTQALLLCAGVSLLLGFWLGRSSNDESTQARDDAEHLSPAINLPRDVSLPGSGSSKAARPRSQVIGVDAGQELQELRIRMAAVPRPARPRSASSKIDRILSALAEGSGESGQWDELVRSEPELEQEQVQEMADKLIIAFDERLHETMGEESDND